MIAYDLHVHTSFSDGKNTPEETVLAAIDKGLQRIGFSDHSYTFFDKSYCMKKEDESAYRSCIALLKEKYADRIEILCGIEQDLYSDMPTNAYDYVIGSVHYLKVGDAYIALDETPEILLSAVKRYFDGDIYSLAEAYFSAVSTVAENTGADIIGHFDLITKFNESGRLFDETHPRYVAAYKAAADRLIKSGKPFEINTGAMSRGYKATPYPSASVIEYIRSQGGRFVLSSDSHSADTLCFAFDRFKALAE